MNRAPEWTEEEFDFLLHSNTLSSELVCAHLQERTSNAVQIVRNGIHEFHTKGDSSLLSKMMKERLAISVAELACPICGQVLAGHI